MGLHMHAFNTKSKIKAENREDDMLREDGRREQCGTAKPNEREKKGTNWKKNKW